MRFGKKKHVSAAWCPVCRRQDLHASATGFSWKCRSCGSRIPDATLKMLIVRRVEEMAVVSAREDHPE